MGCPFKIAIIGGGASGTLTAINLLKKSRTPLEIYLVEKKKEAAFRGIAYSSNLPYEPLNVPVGKMSVYSDAPDHFFNWLKENKQPGFGTEITKESFISRRWYGDYLSYCIKEVVSKTKQHSFHLINNEVSDIQYSVPYGYGYRVIFANGETLSTDYLVFATGNEAPADVFNTHDSALLNGNYKTDAWTSDPSVYVKPDKVVLVVGTGLTMVDNVVSLHLKNHTGKIYCFSRHGYLPLTHDEVRGYNLEFSHNSPELSNILLDLRKNIGVANSRNISWQSVFDAMRECTPQIWRSLSTDSKRIFLRRLRQFWEIHRHRMPGVSAGIIDNMRKEGKLEIIAGTIKGLSVSNGSVLINYIPRDTKTEKLLTVDHIINCTGPSGDYTKTNNTLIKNLLLKGLMKQDELKLGIDTGPNGEIIKSDGTILQNAVAIGPLRKATEWETTAIHEIRAQAEAAGAQISALV